MDYLKLSKEVSFALRHAPWEYELELDDLGWVKTAQLIDALQQSKKWSNLTEDDLYKMMELSDKKRHEIADGKIRAFYGHSTPKHIEKKPMQPPSVLYHGTAKRHISKIMKEGLLPQRRQYVHLSVDKDTALQVGKRHDENPILLQVDAKQAYDQGVLFYFGNDMVWLADNFPSEYIMRV